MIITMIRKPCKENRGNKQVKHELAKERKRSIRYAKLCHRTKTNEGTVFLNANNLPGKILP